MFDRNLPSRASAAVVLILCALAAVPARAQRHNLGAAINTQWNEIIPIISADGKTLYFDRKEYPLNVGGKEDHDDVWMSTLQPDSTWSTAIDVKALNTQNPNAIFSILPDNNTVLYWGAIDSARNLTFAIVQRTVDGWTAPKLLHIKNFYNNAGGITASLASNGRTMLMAIKRNDSPGPLNIYVSFLEDDQTNSWSEPKSLGPVINTRSGESSPLLGADGTTLFFSSGRPGGVGSIDIYVSRRLDSTWQHWSTPVHMGSDFNIPGENYMNSITASGEYAFLAGSVENPGQNLDIFRIRVPDSLRVRPVVLLKGRVLRAAVGKKDPLAGKPLAARLVYERLRDGVQLGIANTDPATGAFQIAFPGGEDYGVRVESDGFIPVSDHLDFRALAVYTEKAHDFLLPPLAAGSNISLNNIFFDFGKAELKSGSNAELNRLALVMKKNPSVAIAIEGHTDDVGTDAANDALSLARAQAVKNYLVSRGIPAARIAAKGIGKREPIAPNDTDEGRSKNRRVVMRVMGK